MSKYSTIFIATFSPWRNGHRISTNGMIEPLLYYFLPRFRKVWLLDQPYPGSNRYFPIVEQYTNNKLVRKTRTKWVTSLLMPWIALVNKPGTHIVFKIRDLLSTLETGIKVQEPFDIFVGMESINAIAGIILRRFGKVKKVCYYCSDYSPTRFKIKIVNNFYLWLDKMAVQNADFVWDVSPAMQLARINAGLDSSKSAPVIHVPNALFKEQISSLAFNKRIPHTAVFVGTLGLENGPDIAIEAFKTVVKEFPKAHLHMFGGGGKGFEGEYLTSLISKYQLEKSVTFHGFVKEINKVSFQIKHFQVALAPYRNIPGSIRLYGDATKIRLYLASGLPIITTSVPPLGREAVEKKAGLIANDNSEEFAKTIIQIFKDSKIRKGLTQAAIKLGKNNTWENTYDNAILKM